MSSKNYLAIYAKSFNWAGFFLPKKTYDKCSALYDFCRVADNIADDENKIEIKKDNFIKFRNNFLNKNYDDPVIKNMWHLINEFNISTKIVGDLFEGINSDIKENVHLNSKKELLVYSYRVAGTVGLMMAKILNVRKEQSLKSAIDLGIAMQLTNIARDVYEDANMGRVYLPIELIGNVEIDSIIEPSEEQEKNIKTSIKNLLYEAEKFYNSALYGTRFIPLKARLPILIASVCYREIGRKLIRNDCDTWQERTTISTVKKLILVLKAVMYLFTKPFNIKKSETSKRNLLKIFLNEDNKT